MKTISLALMQSQVQSRKAALGLADMPAEIEALRNKGAGRTEAKRELLRRVTKRAGEAGLEPVPSYF